MSVPPEALQKLLIEMDNQLHKSKAELSMVNLQLDKVNTNLGLIESTKKSLGKYTTDHENVWQGIGKAFVVKDVNVYLQDISKDAKDFEDKKENLSKKKVYLETTLEKTLESMTQIVGKKK